MTPSNDAQVQESFRESFDEGVYNTPVSQMTPNDLTSTPKSFSR